MGTKLVSPRRNGTRKIDTLTDQQRAFISELLAEDEFNASRAAKKAGYARPGTSAGKLLKHPVIQRALGKAQREREERCQLTADDVLNYLRNVLYFNPLTYFRPSADGKGWIVEDLDVLPEWVGRLIDGMEVKQTEMPDGTVHTTFKVQLVSKATALSLAMKHTTVDQQEVNVNLNAILPKLLEEVNSNGDIIGSDIIEAEVLNAVSETVSSDSG